MNEDCKFEITAVVGRKGNWRVFYDESVLTLTAIDGDESFQIQRADIKRNLFVRELFFGDPLLVVQIDKIKITFKLKKTDAVSLKKWMGAQTTSELKNALKQRLKPFIPLGILLIVLSLPLPADPETGFEAMPFDGVTAFFGISSLTSSILGLLWPRRIWFALDCILILLLALNIVVGIIGGNSLWLVLAILALFFAAQACFSEYHRFAKVSDE